MATNGQLTNRNVAANEKIRGSLNPYTMATTITLHATGETITFTRTGGELLEMHVTLPAGKDGPPLHIHTRQTETFTAVEGRLGLVCGAQEIMLEPGQSFTIPPGTPHRYFSADGGALAFTATFSPALGIEYILTEIFASCNGRRSKDPAPFDGMYVLAQARGEYLLADVPVFVQCLVFPAMAFVGKRLGLVKARPRP